MTSNPCRDDPSAESTSPESTTPAWRRRLLLAWSVGVALLGPACVPAAYAEGRLVQVDVVDRDSGDVLHVYRDHGRPVVAGRPGARYAVRVANRSGGRVMLVVSVDGVNIMTGETAAVGQDGYVLEPWQSTLLTGWRKTHSEVAAFEFTGLSNSYAARTGRPDDVGVIGVAVFREKPAPQAVTPSSRAKAGAEADAATTVSPPAAMPLTVPTPVPVTVPSPGARESRSSAGDAAALASARPAPTERLGTGHGQRETSWVVDTTFDRLDARPQEITRIRYDSLSNLLAAGIAPSPRPVAQDGPRAFPGDPEPGFVPDPPVR